MEVKYTPLRFASSLLLTYWYQNTVVIREISLDKKFRQAQLPLHSMEKNCCPSALSAAVSSVTILIPSPREATS